MGRTRTNIEIDDDALRRVMDRYHLKTKTEAVDLALRKLAGELPMTREEMLAMEGAFAIGEVPSRAESYGWVAEDETGAAAG